MTFRGEWEGVEWEGGMPKSLKEAGFVSAPMKAGRIFSLSFFFFFFFFFFK